MQIKVQLERSDLDGLHDTIIEALDLENVSDEDIIGYWEKLPMSIKLSAIHWGVNDSVVRDEIFDWLQKNIVND